MSEQNNNRTKWLHVRLKPEQYPKIQLHCSKTTCRKLSEYSRKNLLQKPIITNYRNQFLDDFMTEAIKLRNELNSIGNNFNQAVKKLHTLSQITEFKSWIIYFETEEKNLANKISEIKNFIEKNR